jgi:hypothetical protein
VALGSLSTMQPVYLSIFGLVCVCVCVCYRILLVAVVKAFSNAA